MRRAARTDANQAQIVAALRRMGAYVVDLSAVGMGVPDLLVGWRGAWHLIEVKDGRKALSRQRLTRPEQLFASIAHDQGLPCHVVTSIDEALVALGVRDAAA